MKTPPVRTGGRAGLADFALRTFVAGVLARHRLVAADTCPGLRRGASRGAS